MCEKKVEYEGTLNDLYENDLNKFVEYNLQDVKLVKKIDDKLNFIEISRGLAHLGHCPYEDVFMSSRYLEGAILVYLRKNNIVAPNRRSSIKNCKRKTIQLNGKESHRRAV